MRRPKSLVATLERLLACDPEKLPKLSANDLCNLEDGLVHLARLHAAISKVNSDSQDDMGLVGQSATMRALRKQIRTVAPSRASILILGENGTGKERVADALVACSPLNGAPFVKVNCGAFAEGVLESELFGHVQGAFSGAVASHEGVFERANGGTLFLDEVGELSPATQVKLLRVLQEGTFVPVGGKKERKVEVRIIAATNRDLTEMRKRGSFRDDLYFRLAVVTLTIPPFRERLEDLPELVQTFIERETGRQGDLIARTMTKDLITTLQKRAWPGNVRELENTVRRLMALAANSPVLDSHLLDSADTIDVTREPSATGYDLSEGLQPLVHELERAVIRQALETGGTMTAAAALLQLTQPGLRAKMDRLGISPHRLSQKAS
jgi:two-component system response regulator HupR/HoxA